MKTNLLWLSTLFILLISGNSLRANCSSGEIEIKISVTPLYFPTEISWELVRKSDDMVIASRSCGYYTSTNTDETLVCVSDTSTYIFKAYDDYGDGWNSGMYEISYVSTGCLITSDMPNNSIWGDYNSNCIGFDLESAKIINAGNFPQGCMDPSAANYDPCALVDDGSCYFNDFCGGGEATVVVKIIPPSDPLIQWFPQDISWVILDSGNDTVASAACGSIDALSFDTVCLLFTETYTFQAYDDFGDGWEDGQYKLYFAQTGCEIISGEASNFYAGDNVRNCSNSDLETTATIDISTAGLGCMNPNAANYSPCAVVDDGSCVLEPTNNLCIDAILINCGDTIYSSTLYASEDQQPASYCGTTPEAPGIWYRINGTGDDITISSCGSSYDTKINVYNAISCSREILESNCVAGNDDACGLQSKVTFATQPNKSYYILINGYRDDVGTLKILAECSEPCVPQSPNNICQNATEIHLQYNGNCNMIQGDNTCAYTYTGFLNCDKFKPIKDVWYTFYTGESTDLFLDLNAVTAQNMKYALYEDCFYLPAECINAGNGGQFELNGLIQNKYYYLQIWNNGDGDEGTFEFCVYDTGAVTVCNDSIEYTEEDEILSTSANLLWSSTPNDEGYQIKGRKVGAPNFTYIDVASSITEVTLTNLIPNTVYEWQVAKLCDTLNSIVGPYTDLRTFQTEICYSPDDIFASNITSNSARLNWVAYEEVTGYKVLGRQLGKPTVIIYIYDPLQDYLDMSLVSNATYEWTIMALCGNIVAPIQMIDTFMTLISTKTDENEDDPMWEELPGFSIYPNPVSNEFSVYIDIAEETVFNYEIISIDGRVIKEGEFKFSSNQPLTLLRNELHSGVYHIRVYNDSANYIDKVLFR